eukprot:scaffold44631_cov26-Tisochrysis_lutea.AAC.2
MEPRSVRARSDNNGTSCGALGSSSSGITTAHICCGSSAAAACASSCAAEGPLGAPSACSLSAGRVVHAVETSIAPQRALRATGTTPSMVLRAPTSAAFIVSASEPRSLRGLNGRVSANE